MHTGIKTKIIQTGIALLAVLIVGTFGYYFLTGESSDLFTCFYMTVVTITTIGFNEIIELEKYPGARPFTVFLAFAGIGLLTYFVSTVSALIIEGNLRESYRKIKMEKTISKYRDHYIICGAGRHSLHLIEELVTTKRESIFIEIDAEVIKRVLKKFPLQKYIEGDATHDEILIKAGVEKAKGLFAATTNDNINLVICLSAKRLNPNLKIVSLCSIHNNEAKLEMAGATQIVSPNYIGGLRMASEMLRPTVTSLLDVMLRGRDKNLRFEQIDLNQNNEGKKMGELRLGEFKDTLLIAIKSNDELIFKPEDNYEIKKGDSLIIMTTPDERIKLENFS
jgi:voltage-gated potassium channel